MEYVLIGISKNIKNIQKRKKLAQIKYTLFMLKF